MLSDLLAYWQRQLRIQDWDITLDVVPARVISAAAGCSTNCPGRRNAHIRLADPATLDPDAGSDYTDQEVTLVHELLHVALAAIPDHGPIEPAIDSLARALVHLNRGNRR
jgi:hypothetical protein